MRPLCGRIFAYINLSKSVKPHCFLTFAIYKYEENEDKIILRNFAEKRHISAVDKRSNKS